MLRYQPAPGGVFVYHVHVTVAILGKQIYHVPVGKPIIHRAPQPPAARDVKRLDDVNVFVPGNEELPRANLKITVTPGPFEPAGQIFEIAFIFRVDKNVVAQGDVNEPGCRFPAPLPGIIKQLFSPRVPHTARVKAEIHSRLVIVPAGA